MAAATFLTRQQPRGGWRLHARQRAGRRRAHFTVADQIAADQRAYALGDEWIAAHPLAATRLVPLKIWRLWAPDGEGEWWFQRGYAGYDRNAMAFRLVRGVNQAFYALVLLAWIASLPSLWRATSRDRAWLMLTPCWCSI